jgi:hypothetical protein
MQANIRRKVLHESPLGLRRLSMNRASSVHPLSLEGEGARQGG